MYIPQDSPFGATLADLLVASAQPVTSPHACAEVGLGSDSNVQPHEQKTNALPLCQRPGSEQKHEYLDPHQIHGLLLYHFRESEK